MSHPFAEGSSNHLEMEVNTTKDSIWRLTNRVCVLESEFKRLKNFLKGHILTPSSSAVETTKKTAKPGKMFHKEKQMEESNTGARNNEVAVKREAESGSDSSDYDMAVEDCNVFDIDAREDFQNAPSLGNTNNNSDDEDSDSENSDSSESDEDYKAKIRIKSPKELFAKYGSGRLKSGRKKSNIWTRFKQMEVVAENGRRTTITICKYCKGAVSSRGTRLRKHLEKCIISPKVDPFGIAESIVKKVQSNESVANKVGDNDVDYEAIAAEAVSLSPVKSGRKRTPIWRHFIRKPKPATPDRPARKYSIIAICKNCQTEVSAKVIRMKLHLSKCLARTGNPKSIGSLTNDIKEHLYSTSTTPDAPQTIISEPEIPVEVSTSMAEIEILNSVPLTVSNPDISNCAQSTSTPTADVSSSDNEAKKRNINEASTNESSSLSTGPQSKRSSSVWRHYNITNEMKDGRVCITSACKYCNKIVSAKPVRLAVHLTKCKDAKAEEN